MLAEGLGSVLVLQMDLLTDLLSLHSFKNFQYMAITQRALSPFVLGSGGQIFLSGGQIFPPLVIAHCHMKIKDDSKHYLKTC